MNKGGKFLKKLSVVLHWWESMMGVYNELIKCKLATGKSLKAYAGSGQFMLSTQLIMLNYPICSVSLK